MPVKKIVKRIFDESGETVKKVAEETGKQIVNTGQQFEAQLLYGSTTLTNEEVQKGLTQDKIDAKKDIGDIQHELAMHQNSGPNGAGEVSNLNRAEIVQHTPSDALWGNGESTTPKTTEQKQLASEHHRRQVDDVLGGQRGENVEEEKLKQKAQEETREGEIEKQKKKQALEQTIEAPAGRTVGIAFKRKKNTPRMRPPKTGENKIGQGGRE